MFFGIFSEKCENEVSDKHQNTGKTPYNTRKNCGMSSFYIGGPKRKFGGPTASSHTSPYVLPFFTFLYQGSQ